MFYMTNLLVQFINKSFIFAIVLDQYPLWENLHSWSFGGWAINYIILSFFLFALEVNDLSHKIA